MKKLFCTVAFLLTLVAMTAEAQILTVSPSSLSSNGATACVSVDKTIASVTFLPSGSWTATLAPRVRFDVSGSTNVTPPDASISVASVTTNAPITVANYGVRRICLTTTAYTSGTINLTAVAGGSSLNELAILAALNAAAANDPPHDDPDSGNPVKIGGRALSFGTNPTSVANNDRTNSYFTRDGQMFMIGGHPNVLTRECRVADADGAQTGAACVTVSAGSKIVVTRAKVTCSASNTVNVAVRIMFDTDSTFASASTTGVAGGILSEDGIYPGGGAQSGDGSGIIGVGADDEDVRYTMADPVTGACSINISYFTITG